jgi:hypothetical protein
VNSLNGGTFNSAEGFLKSQGEELIIKMNFRKYVVAAVNKWIWSVREQRDELWQKTSSSLTLSSDSSLKLSSDGRCVGLNTHILEEKLKSIMPFHRNLLCVLGKKFSLRKYFGN